MLFNAHFPQLMDKMAILCMTELLGVYYDTSVQDREPPPPPNQRPLRVGPEKWPRLEVALY